MRLRLAIAAILFGSLSLPAFSRAASSSSAPLPPKIPILVYHHLRSTKPYARSTWSYKMSVTPSIHAKQLQWIEDHGYVTVDLTTAAAILRGERQGPEKPIVITYDDNNLTQMSAAEELHKHGQIGVFYLVANRLDNKSFLSRDQVKTMVSWGMDVESHTMTHSTMTNLTLKKLEWELAESKRILEELTGKPILHVAYPSTAQNKTVRERTKAAGYVTGTIMDPRRATAKDDLFKLPRIQMNDETNLAKVLP